MTEKVHRGTSFLKLIPAELRRNVGVASLRCEFALALGRLE